MNQPYKSWGRQRSFRRPNQSYAFAGLLAHVTVCVADGQPNLSPIERKQLLEVILEAAQDERWDALALCVMPDHFHLLLQTNADTVSLGQIIGFIKKRYAVATTGKNRWQDKFHDHLLRCPQSRALHRQQPHQGRPLQEYP